MRVWAPAKVNLFLEVLGRRPDGYHELATLMTAVSLYDTLELTGLPSDEVRLTCDHPSLSTGPENLVCRAVELVRQSTGRRDGVAVRLLEKDRRDIDGIGNILVDTPAGPRVPLAEVATLDVESGNVNISREGGTPGPRSAFRPRLP